MRTLVMFAALCAVTSTAVTAALAGPLVPPSGAVTSTGKTLVEVEPRIAINATNTPGDADSLYRITQRGSYYLTENLVGAAGKHGIEIASSDVTIDLSGFHLVGVASGTLDGITISIIEQNNITILNGGALAWGGAGIRLSLAGGSRIEGVTAKNNGSTGIVGGSSGVIERCIAENNGGGGIAAGSYSRVKDCTSLLNGAQGIVTGDDCVITHCISSSSVSNGLRTGTGCIVSKCVVTSNGADGIRVSLGSTVEGCIANMNALDGIECNSDCTIRDNNCDGNGTSGTTGAGIHITASGNHAEGNRCSDADRGMDVDGPGNVIIRNICRGNTTNWSIVLGNHYGPIIDRSVVTAPPAVNGSSATEALGSTHPNANFTY